MENVKEMEYLNVGCGNTSIENAINMDVAVNEFTNPDIIGDLLDIPFHDKTFKGLILSHVLEHLPKSKHIKALNEIWRVLKSNGTVYIEVPDLEQVVKNYLDNHLGKKDYWYMAIYGRDLYDADRHLSGVTSTYLTDLLFANGFSNLKWKNRGRDIAVLSVLAEKVEAEENDSK